MDRVLTLLIVGGYGTFGGRLVDLLQDESRLTLVVAGRSSRRAEDFCAARSSAAARLVPAVFERDGEARAQIAALAPDVLVDASGPFQAYGAPRYRLIEACIALRVAYLDLADGSEFVAGVPAFDAAARAAGIYVLSGVSSFPVLTAAVARRLAVGVTRVATIRGGIAPTPYAGVGVNVIRAVAGYAGQPVRLRRHGRAGIGYPFTESLRYTIAPPGKIPLRRTLFSLVDVPDLRVLADLWPGADAIWMGAGPTPESLHRLLQGLAWLVRGRLVRSLAPLARLMATVMTRVRWGEHRGGMFVSLSGTDGEGRPVRRSWHLLAEGDDGPLIPSMALEALVRRVLDGSVPAPGARAGATALELADYEALFARRAIVTGVRDDLVEPAQLFERLAGSAWSMLPGAVRRLHAGGPESIAHGRVDVQRGTGLLANAVASLFGFPAAAQDLPLQVRFRCAEGVERWTRTFGRRAFTSRLSAGRGPNERLLVERFGLLDFAQALVVEGNRLRLVLRRWSLGRIPLPRGLAPRSDSYEFEADGRFRFHVEISHAWLGLLVRYQGWLTDGPAPDV